MPHPKKLLSRLAAFDRAEGLIAPRDSILIALSGGADSVCLAHHLARIARRRNLRLTALHIHHGLRAREADRDAAFAEKTAARLGLPFVLKRVSVSEFARDERRSLEDAARVLRYETFHSVARRFACDVVATGHHADDQAETLLLHLLRGKKAKGLGGIAPKRPLKKKGRGSKITLIRPLLDLSRKEILAYLKAYGLKHRTDSSNREERFTRNWIRRKVLPLLETRNPGLRANLLAIAADVRRLTSS